MSVCENENWRCPCLRRVDWWPCPTYCGLHLFDIDDEFPTTCDFSIPLKTVAEDPQGWKLLVVDETVYRALMRGNGIGAARGEE